MVISLCHDGVVSGAGSLRPGYADGSNDDATDPNNPGHSSCSDYSD